MKIKLLITVFAVLLMSKLSAQKPLWNANVNYFFDNTEYAKSTITKDQTMTGVHFTPELGLALDSVHSFFAGGDFLKVAGSDKFVDYIEPIAYYRYHTQKSTFYAGVFPRSELFSNYSDLFFQDSVAYFKPTIQGIFWQAGTQNSFFNLWLDWTGHQSPTVRETFFVGASAHQKIGLMFVDLQSYMFHFAKRLNMSSTDHLCDNILAHLSVGVDYSNQTGLDTLLFAAGVLAGAERDRGGSFEPGSSSTPVGCVVRLNAEYKGFGTQNMLYWGDRRDVFYNNYSNALYWNNPFLRAGFYFQSKWYLDVIRSQSVNGKLSMNLHFSEGKMMFEQVFTLKTMLTNSVKPNFKSKPTLMANWFK